METPDGDGPAAIVNALRCDHFDDVEGLGGVPGPHVLALRAIMEYGDKDATPDGPGAPRVLRGMATVGPRAARASGGAIGKTTRPRTGREKSGGGTRLGKYSVSHPSRGYVWRRLTAKKTGSRRPFRSGAHSSVG